MSLTTDTCDVAVADYNVAMEQLLIAYDTYSLSCEETAIPSANSCSDLSDEGYSDVTGYMDAVEDYLFNAAEIDSCYEMIAPENIDEACADFADLSANNNIGNDCYECSRLVLYFEGASALFFDRECEIDDSRGDCYAQFASDLLAEASEDCQASFDAGCITARDSVWSAWKLSCAAFADYDAACEDAAFDDYEGCDIDADDTCDTLAYCVDAAIPVDLEETAPMGEEALSTDHTARLQQIVDDYEAVHGTHLEQRIAAKRDAKHAEMLELVRAELVAEAPAASANGYDATLLTGAAVVGAFVVGSAVGARRERSRHQYTAL